MQDHAAEVQKLVHDYFTTAEAVDGHYVTSLLLQLEELANELEKVSFNCLEVVPPPSAHNDGPSIASEEELRDAMDEFEGVVHRRFNLLHCWSILRTERKWQDTLSAKVKEHRGKGKASASASAPGSESGAACEGRPIGRVRAKKLRSGEGGSSSSSACLEVLQRLTVSREADTQARDAKVDNLLQVEAEKVALKKEHLMLQREAIEVQKNLLQFKVSKASSADTEREDQIIAMDMEGLLNASVGTGRLIRMKLLIGGLMTISVCNNVESYFELVHSVFENLL
ncbi:hypothetical protein BAE44_0011959 [Dichanthelium oligosanthes]|uniref:No apical meristem-associated C-terminal domain-containing protein n=1 Tax=Dichanthelium oligosanthes TaxID=888268 RepID=A0A1E5VPM7_9POAL|nr:hypothetical protein BAE44_0011959 [Dichanthelium oligosanthes]